MIVWWIFLGYVIVGIITAGILKALYDTDCIELYDEEYIIAISVFWIIVIPIWIVYHITKFIIEKIKELT